LSKARAKEALDRIESALNGSPFQEVSIEVDQGALQPTVASENPSIPRDVNEKPEMISDVGIETVSIGEDSAEPNAGHAGYLFDVE
jgi:hypothetical protein